MNIAIARDAQERAIAKTIQKQEQLCELSQALSVSREREEFLRLVTDEIELYNSMVEKKLKEKQMPLKLTKMLVRKVKMLLSQLLVTKSLVQSKTGLMLCSTLLRRKSTMWMRRLVTDGNYLSVNCDIDHVSGFCILILFTLDQHLLVMTIRLDHVSGCCILIYMKDLLGYIWRFDISSITLQM